MGKSLSESKNRIKDGDAKVLYRKSNATMFTPSRTFSGASQIYSRSGILQLKKNLEKNQNYYVDGGKAKRDLSVETDVCILRRYYRSKKNKMSVSGKSKYSTLVDTEVETIEEFPDQSACGDNETEDKSTPPLDIACLMIDNLKDLLNQWIQKHLIENKDTKQKIDTVLETLIQKLHENNNLASSSGSTYVLHKEAISQEVKDKKVATTSMPSCQYCKQKLRNVKVGSSSNDSAKNTSSFTIPFQCKDIRIISTLSIPRTFNQRGSEEKKDQNSSYYRMKKIKHKNIIFSIDKSNKLIDSSSFDLVEISTKSLTKKCTNCEMNVREKKKKRHIVFFPQSLYKSATDTSSTTNNDSIKRHYVEINKHQLEDMPSLLKSFYANDPAIAASINKNIQYCNRNDNCTMTEDMTNKMTANKSKIATDIPETIYDNENNNKQVSEENQHEPIVPIDFADQLQQFTTIKKSKSKMINCYKKPFNKGKINKQKRRFPTKLLPSCKDNKFQSIHNKQFTFLYKKARDQISQENDFFKHCHNIMEYFEDYDGNKNIRLDVRINVFPTCENETKDVCTDISKQTLGMTMYDNKGTTLLYNVQPTQIDTPVRMDEESTKDQTERSENESSEFPPEIIPILDGATSQTKYIFNVHSKEKFESNSKANSVMARSTLTNDLEIAQEISELRAVIRDLAAAAERFVSEQLQKESNKSHAGTSVSHNSSSEVASSSKSEAVINISNLSKAIQYSKEFISLPKTSPGLKLSKEPRKKDTFDFYHRLTRKSTSYRIIDSESVLRVTDMTSKAYQNRDMNEASFVPKSRSLFEMTSEQRSKRKMVTSYYDKYQNNLQCNVCSVHRNPSPRPSQEELCQNKKWYERKKKKEAQSRQPEMKLPPCICGTTSNTASSVPRLSPMPTDYNYNSTIKICFPDQLDDEIDRDDDSIRTSIEEVRLQKCCKVRRGMGFGEGCVYCMLLWIPVLIIACLFYGYVLKEKIKYSSSNKMSLRGPDIKPIMRFNNSSAFEVKLSDLGF